jgi:hypothetical protein
MGWSISGSLNLAINNLKFLNDYYIIILEKSSSQANPQPNRNGLQIPNQDTKVIYALINMTIPSRIALGFPLGFALRIVLRIVFMTMLSYIDVRFDNDNCYSKLQGEVLSCNSDYIVPR